MVLAFCLHLANYRFDFRLIQMIKRWHENFLKFFVCFGKYSLSDKPIIKQFEPEAAATQTYPITEYQPIYFISNSFKEAKDQIKLDLF
jgi:hypothetical protein